MYIRPPPSSFGTLGITTVAGGEVDEYQLTLRVSSDDLEPEDISTLLGIEPTSARRMGDLVGEPREGGPTARTGSWHLKTPAEPGAGFEGLVTALLNRLPADQSVWAALRENCKVDLFCGVFLRNWNRGMTLSPEMMNELSRRGIELGLDIYAPNDA